MYLQGSSKASKVCNLISNTSVHSPHAYTHPLNIKNMKTIIGALNKQGPFNHNYKLSSNNLYIS